MRDLGTFLGGEIRGVATLDFLSARATITVDDALFVPSGQPKSSTLRIDLASTLIHESIHARAFDGSRIARIGIGLAGVIPAGFSGGDLRTFKEYYAYDIQMKIEPLITSVALREQFRGSRVRNK